MGDDYYGYYQPTGKQGRQGDAVQQIRQGQPAQQQQYQAAYSDQQQHAQHYQDQGYQQPYYPAAPPQVPVFAANPTAQLGLHIGTQAFSAGHDYLNKNVPRPYTFAQVNASAAFLFLKQYFDVTNAFVLRKIALLLFPFGHKVTRLTTITLSLGNGASCKSQAEKPPSSLPVTT